MTSLHPHRRRLRLVALSVVPVVGAGLLVATAPVSAARRDAGPVATRAAKVQSAASTHTVTLITGDVVRLRDHGDGTSSTEVTRAPGARGGIRSETIGGHLYVVPDEAMPYLASQRVDRRLFDITGLVEQGYDDERSGRIPLIVSYTSDAAAAAAALPASTTVRTLRSVDGVAVRTTKTRARSLWKALTPARTRAVARGPRSISPDSASVTTTAAPLLGGGVESVWLDGRNHVDLAQSTAQIGTAAAWARGLEGDGVRVAVLDTGYDQNHPDLSSRVSLSASFVPGETVQDGNGHGTHTASTVGGSGAASDGLEKGVAPASDLIIGKVLSDAGSGEDSWVIAGMEWAAAQGARVISMSLSGDVPSDGTEPMCQAIDTISASSKALFVVAAGNNGNEGTMSCPSAADSALTVAAVDGDDLLAAFSSMGPRARDYALKPDIAAPGVDVLAAKAGGNADSGWYIAESGTSMATPHVAGAAALVIQQHSDWTGAQVKDALMSTSRSLSGLTAYQVGAGRVDLDAATSASITATGSAYFGFVSWPHPDPAPMQRTITYSNSSANPVQLRLSESVAIAGGPYDVDPGADAGTPAPDGMFTLSTDRVTVPARGTATVTATAVPAMGQIARRYLGQVVARTTGGDVVARTQVGLYEEEERYTVTVRLRDRAGKPTAGSLAVQRFGIPDPTLVNVDDTGDLKLRLLPGTYSIVSYLEVPGSHGKDSHGVALLGAPQVVADHDQTVDLDASKAAEVKAVVPKRTEDRMLFLDWFRSDGGESTIASQYLLPGYVDSMFALPTGTVTRGEFEFEARWRKAFPLLTMRVATSEVRIIGQAGSALYSGRSRSRLVYAGTGTASEYPRRARGAVVVVRRSDAISAGDRAAAAAAAGARLLVVVADTDAPLNEYVGTPAGADSAVPVVAVSRSTGDRLIAKAGATRRRVVQLQGTPDSPYVYDLAAPYPGRIPSTLTFRPRAQDLATVDMRFHGTTERTGGEFRWDYRPYRPSAFGLMLRQTMPSTRVDYVSTQPGVQWAEAAVTGPEQEWVTSSETHSLTAGRRTTNNFFNPVAHPSNGGAFWNSTRYSGFVAFNVQPWSDGGTGRAGYMQFADTKRLLVYADGEQVADSEWASATIYPVPDGEVRYKLDLTTSRDPRVYPLSPRTRTVWKVHSPAITHGLDTMDTMAVLQVSYDVATDLAGRAARGRQSIGVAVTHLPGAVGAGKVGRPTVQVSYDDGAHWRTVEVTSRGPGSGRASFVAPTRGYVSLRVIAQDDAGNAVTQDVIRAYGVR
jgi:subtilisin family serine protease